MSFLTFAKAEFEAATARGVKQCVLLGSKPDILEPVAAGASIQFFDGVAPETMATVLDKSGFDSLKATLFVWLGGAGAHTAETAMSTLAFVASLPKGSGVLLDYVAERSSLGSRTHSALDALASRKPCRACCAGLAFGRLQTLARSTVIWLAPRFKRRRLYYCPVPLGCFSLLGGTIPFIRRYVTILP